MWNKNYQKEGFWDRGYRRGAEEKLSSRQSGMFRYRCHQNQESSGENSVSIFQGKD